MEYISLRVRQFTGWLIGLIGLITAFLSGWDIVEKLFKNQPDIYLYALGYLLLLVTLMTGYFVFRQYQTIRKERYANITPYLHRAMHGIRDLQTYVKEKAPPAGANADAYDAFDIATKQKISQIIDQLAKVFQSITSTHCRASVKLIYEFNNDLYFYTFARDPGSSEKLLPLDQKRAVSNHDPLNKNTRFAQLFSVNENLWHYVSNDLAKDDQFKTTSMTAYCPDHIDRINAGWRHFLNWKWPLPYRSTIACVIRQGPFDLLPNRTPKVLGFVTVDSESRNVFVEKWDVELVFSVADALFQPLEQIIAVQQAGSAAVQQAGGAAVQKTP